MMRLKLYTYLLFFNLLSFPIIVAADGNILEYGESHRPDTLDPYTSRELSSQRISELLFNGLVAINNKQEITPDLAESWESDMSNNSFTFQLRKDVYWHTHKGEKANFSADDVVFTYKLISHPKTRSLKKGLFENIESVEKINEFSVRFYLKKQLLNSLAIFSFKILPKHVLGKNRYLRKSNKFANNPIGTGPYQFSGVTNKREIKLIANEDYFNGKPKIQTIISKPFSDENIMNQALSFNAIDMIINVNPRHISELKADKRFTISPFNTLSYSFFAYNQKNKHLANKKVREALSHSINRGEMLRAFFNNRGTIISGPFAPGSWAYNLDVQPVSYNPVRSINLLKEAGYIKKPKGFYDVDGKPLQFTLKVAIEKNDESTKRIILAYSNFLKKIGVSLSIDFLEREAWKADIFKNRKFDITLASLSFDDSSDITSLFHSQYDQPWDNNFISYNNPKVDQLLEEIEVTLDHEAKRTISHRLHRVIADDFPYTFLWSLTNYAAYNNKLKQASIHQYKFFNQVYEWEMD